MMLSHCLLVHPVMVRSDLCKDRLSKSSTMTTSDHGAILEVEVESLRSTYVKPQKLLGRKDIQLTTFDLQCLSFKYIQMLMVYRSEDKFEDVEEKLKNGLGLVLEDYFPLAGKMVIDEEGIFRVEYDDDMDGAEWKTASAKEDVYVDYMVEGNRVEELLGFFPCNGYSNFKGLSCPLLAIQLTKLKDGFAMGCALNHAVVDGTSTWHFLNAWAEKCGGSTLISIKPFHDRTKARNTCVKMNLPLTLKNPEFIKVPVSHVFTFSGSTVNKIKSNANEHQTNGKPFSTFQCVAEHVWRAITRARQLMPEDMTTVIVFANSRRRIEPPVPEGYFGNIVTAAHTSTAAGVLFTSPSGRPASMIQKAIEMHDSNAIDQVAKGWERNAKPFRFSDFGNNLVCFGSSPRFKYYELDFGWGMPEMVRRGVNNRFDGSVHLHQGKNGDGSIDVYINLEDKVMKRLEMDEEFLMTLQEN